ncbi:MAG TPA: dihydrofolate reductase [Microvirga sp.]|jgi:dihydrofolate reductase|nr:dihydrofolate reductase [Microvirga sp.]
MTLPLVIVVAVAENGVIGHDNRLLWHIRSDLRRFRELTWGKPMIMGRKTFASIGKPLPGRETVVLTRDPAFAAEGVHVARSWDEAVAAAERLAGAMGADAVAVVGGAEIYALALPRAARIHLTEVHAAPDGDTRFPPFDRTAFRERSRKSYPAGPNDEHPFTTIDLERRRAP